MLSESDVKTYIDRRFPIGEKGYVKLWREGDALGVVVMSCQEDTTSKLKIPTEWWGGHRGVVKVRDSELNALKELMHFFDTQQVSFELPGIMTRGRFGQWTRERIRDHHNFLIENLKSRKGVERAVFGFRYWGDITNHGRMKKWVSDNFKIYVHENPDLPLSWREEADRGSLFYGWGGR